MAVWVVNELKLGWIGFHAVKPFSQDSVIELCLHLTKNVREDLFFVGTALALPSEMATPRHFIARLILL